MPVGNTAPFMRQSLHQAQVEGGGARPMGVNPRRESPLFLVAMYGRLEAVKYIVGSALEDWPSYYCSAVALH